MCLVFEVANSLIIGVVPAWHIALPEDGRAIPGAYLFRLYVCFG